MMGSSEVFRAGVFPPALRVGCRVWTKNAFTGEVPIEGANHDTGGPQGGEIIAIEKRDPMGDLLINTVRWDDGQVSKEYGNQLVCTERFATISGFFKAFALVGKVELFVGPRGGFKFVKFRVRYDGDAVEAETYVPDDWKRVLEPAARRDGVEIVKASYDEAIRKQLDPKQANAEGIFVGFLTAEEIDTASGQRSGRW
jgi:hypothetical protein